MSDNDHILVKKYLEQHSLVESNITSFNNFIGHRMQQIVNELGDSMSDEDIKIKLGKIRIEKPVVIEADGSMSPLTPAEARIRSLTYSAHVFLEISVNYEGHVESHEVEIGKLPVIVKSQVCHMNGLNSEELEKKYMDPLDPGGYFIVNGNERVMVMAEDLAANQPFIEKNSKGQQTLRMFSQRGAYRIPITLIETNEGIIEVSFSRFKNIPAMIMLKALGMLKEAEISRLVGKESDSFIVNLYEFANVQTSEDALIQIAEKAALQGTKKEILDRVKQRIDSYFMPNIGTSRDARMEKALTLCKLIRQLFIAKENNYTTDKDHYANKRVRLSGDLLSDLFRVNLNVLLRDIKYSLQKISKRKKFYSLKTIAKSTLFSHIIESAIATGNWIGERTGVTQNMDKTNYLAILSQLQRVASMLPGEQENFLARTLHPTHYGRFCPIETPEGTEIGLRKNLALLSKISTAVILDETKFIAMLEESGMQIEKEGKKHEALDVFFNGRFIGSVSDGNGFAAEVRKIRRENELSPELSIRIDEQLETVIISTEVGRVLRPLIVVTDEKSTFTDRHKELFEENKLNWNDLVSQGIIEYIDASEEENALVALKEEEITEKTTHLEIDSIDLLGLVTALVPYANHDQSSRLNRGSKTQKQALGLYAANFPVRLDTDVSILHYPQKPVVKSFVYDTLHIYPAGQNVIVAVMTYDGYNMEDALILNKGSVDRGLGRSTYFRPYTAVELHYAGGLADEICIPEKDTAGYRTEESYRFLEDDGIIYTEAKVNEGEVVIGKISPPKFLSEAKDINIKTKKESSSTLRQEESGITDMVFITADNEGNKVIHVRTRDQRIPELGDKFSTAHGQKGVVGLIVPEEDMPFTENGIRPDILFNPHGIPSRMTVGYLLEMLAGKVGALQGNTIDGTAFTNQNIVELQKQLESLGFRYDGKETMYHGITGEKMQAKIFVGNMHYLKLKHMVSNKMHARASGKVTLLTRQPIEGRSKGGALRLGEMEQQALVAHGASLLLKERYDSDKVILHICAKCGSIAIEDNLRKKIYCPLCGSNDTEKGEVAYAVKLLGEELQSRHIKTTFELKNKYE